LRQVSWLEGLKMTGFLFFSMPKLGKTQSLVLGVQLCLRYAKKT
jgi:hypothetical protein